MRLKVQIYSLLYSFFFGIVFFVLLEINCKLLYEGKLIYRVIISFLIIMVLSFLYFLGLVMINNGIIHIYFYLSLFTGYMLSFVIYNKINCKKK